MQYKIVSTDTILFLEERVAQCISEGWIPQGGISITLEDGARRYYQAMIKKKQMTDINEITDGLITMDHDYYDRLDGNERVKVLESIMLWAKWEMNRQQQLNKGQ